MPDVAPWFTTFESWIPAHPGWASLTIGVALVVVAWAACAVTRRYLVVLLGRLGKRTLFRWDGALHERNFYRRLAWAVPLLIVRAGLPLLPVLPDAVATAAQRGVAVGMLVVLASAIGAFVAAIGDVYDRKRGEIAEWTELHPEARENRVNARRLTNVGTFRAYVEGLLRAHSDIQVDATFMVRQLEPTPEGLPLQVYMFVSDTRWTAYEAIQSDVFDHLIAIAPEFGLRLYQKPSGTDLSRLSAAVDAGDGAGAVGVATSRAEASLAAEGTSST